MIDNCVCRLIVRFISGPKAHYKIKFHSCNCSFCSIGNHQDQCQRIHSRVTRCTPIKWHRFAGKRTVILSSNNNYPSCLSIRETLLFDFILKCISRTVYPPYRNPLCINLINAQKRIRHRRTNALLALDAIAFTKNDCELVVAVVVVYREREQLTDIVAGRVQGV